MMRTFFDLNFRGNAVEALRAALEILTENESTL